MDDRIERPSAGRQSVDRGIDDLLRAGFVQYDRQGRAITYRFLLPADDPIAITDMLHRGYAPLAAAGMRFMASHQTVDVTTRRMARGDTIVAVADHRHVGIVTLASPTATTGSPHYDRPDVASVGQFAVEPDFQGTGIGSTLLTMAERLACARGVRELALDTAEPAHHLIRFYSLRGYRFVEFVRWPDVNYRSVILSKPMTPPSRG